METGAIEYVKDFTNSEGVKVDTLQKGKNSIVDKLYRKNVLEVDNYGISDFNDLLRSALLFNPVDTKVEIDVNAIHKSVQHLIKIYKKNSTTAIKDITLELKNNDDTGYKGIHLTLLMDSGITSEIILATPEHWLIKGEQETIYQKTRSYKDRNHLFVKKQLAKSIEIGKNYRFSADLDELLKLSLIKDKTSVSLTLLISTSNTISEYLAGIEKNTPSSPSFKTLSGSETSNITGVPSRLDLIKNFLDIITSPLSKDSLQQNKNDVNPSNRYSLKKEIKVKNGEVQNLNELIPYAVDAKFFTADDAGNKTTDIKYQWVRDNLNSRIKALYTRTNFAYLPELNSTENTIQKRNKIAHQLLEAHTIQNMLVAEQSNLTLQEVIKLNEQEYKNLRL